METIGGGENPLLWPVVSSDVLPASSLQRVPVLPTAVEGVLHTVNLLPSALYTPTINSFLPSPLLI